jgi:DNA topoisomerase-3
VVLAAEMAPATLTAMSKTLVIAEKPSVGQDLARVLQGPFQKNEGFLEGPEQVITWAVGHLVQLAEPDAYDPKYKSWRMADLPIVPERFKLVVRDERSRKQMTVVGKQLAREDIEEVVNACDAGREGELIFAYLYEKAKAKKPVKRLWLNSMTVAAMRDAFAALRPAAEFARLEQAARSRSEADWIVGMNATRAATIRLRSSFDGAVSLGRVQTPTLAIIARREEEIRAFQPEPYWLVDAKFAAGVGAPANDESAGTERTYAGRFHAANKPRIASAEEAEAIVRACEGRIATITKLEKKEQREKAPMLYDLTTLQREANNRYGFSAKRTLGAAQRLYEEHKALTYPRTNSRYLPTDMVEEIKPTVELVGVHAEYRKAAAYVTGLDALPLGRVVNDEKVTDHHAIIPTRSEHRLEKMGPDDRRVYDMVTRRFLAVFHPEAVFENTRVETTVPAPDAPSAEPQAPDGGGYVFRTRGKLLLEPGWRGVYDEPASGPRPTADTKAAGERAEIGQREEDEVADQQLPRLLEGEQVQTREIESARKETKPPRRYSDASLLGAMETAGKLVDDEELREAMKDSGIGTPATRSAIIERLIAVGYVERDGRALVATEKGLNVIRLLNQHALTSPGLTGSWEQRLGKIERGEDSREKFMGDIAGFAQETVKQLDETLKDVRIPRARLGPCPVCGHEIIENRKGYSCWAREDPGCGFVIWKAKAGKQLPIAVARELIKQGYTEGAVTGFRGRSGRSFRAHLALSQTDEGKWRVEFDEPWAKEGVKPPDAEEDAAIERAQDGAGETGAAVGQRSAA